MKIFPTQFDGQAIRRVYDGATDTWWFSVIDIVQVLTDSANARDYWFKMKQRVRLEDGAELSTNCRQLKRPAADGKLRLTDAASAESLLRIVQSIPSPKAEPIKLWLAKVGYRPRSVDALRPYLATIEAHILEQAEISFVADVEPGKLRVVTS